MTPAGKAAEPLSPAVADLDQSLIDDLVLAGAASTDHAVPLALRLGL